MKKYGDSGGDSGIAEYESGEDFIRPFNTPLLYPVINLRLPELNKPTNFVIWNLLHMNPLVDRANL